LLFTVAASVLYNMLKNLELTKKIVLYKIIYFVILVSIKNSIGRHFVLLTKQCCAFSTYVFQLYSFQIKVRMIYFFLKYTSVHVRPPSTLCPVLRTNTIFFTYFRLQANQMQLIRFRLRFPVSALKHAKNLEMKKSYFKKY
jgi:hypothetical protein